MGGWVIVWGCALNDCYVMQGKESKLEVQIDR